MISEKTQKIGRPRQLYTGPTERQVQSLRARAPSYDISLLGSTKSMSNKSLVSKDLEDDFFTYMEGDDKDPGPDFRDCGSAGGSPLKESSKAKFYRPK